MIFAFWFTTRIGSLKIVPPPPATDSAPAPFYIVVLVADDPAESDGDPLRDATGLTPGAGVLRLRSEAFGPAGAHHVVEGIVARPATPPGRSLRLMTMGDVL